MANKDNYRILLLRNEVSLCLDDLVSLVVNSTLASQLRTFSSEVMELTPGFTFNMKKAVNLRDLTRKTLKQYAAHSITDVDLMNYFSEAHNIIKGETLQSGGSHMGIFDKLLHGKEIKQKENLDKLEREYQDVCNQIAACRERMATCVAQCKGQDPTSRIYRDSERAWSSAKNELTLLEKQEAQLRQGLDTAREMFMIKDYAEKQKEFGKTIGSVLGDSKKSSLYVADAELQTSKIDGQLDSFSGLGDTLFQSMSESTRAPITNSEFGAQVAAEEHRDTLRTQYDLPVVSQTQAAPARTEFAAQVDAAARTEE